MKKYRKYLILLFAIVLTPACGLFSGGTPSEPTQTVVAAESPTSTILPTEAPTLAPVPTQTVAPLMPVFGSEPEPDYQLYRDSPVFGFVPADVQLVPLTKSGKFYTPDYSSPVTSDGNTFLFPSEEIKLNEGYCPTAVDVTNQENFYVSLDGCEGPYDWFYGMLPQDIITFCEPPEGFGPVGQTYQEMVNDEMLKAGILADGALLVTQGEGYRVLFPCDPPIALTDSNDNLVFALYYGWGEIYILGAETQST